MTVRPAASAPAHLRALLSAIALAMVAASAHAQPSPTGPDFQVNSFTTAFQGFPAVAAGLGGEFVIVWDSDGSLGNDNSGLSTQAQTYAADAEPLGPQFQVNTYSTGSQIASEVAKIPDGSFVVAWTSDGSPGDDDIGYSIQARRFARDGTPLGDQFQANSYTMGSQTLPAVAAAGSGGFVAAWRSIGSSGSDGDLGSIQLRRFGSDGLPLAPDVQVNTYTTGNQGYTDVAADAQGRFVVVWSGDGSAGTDTDQQSIHARRYAADGSPLGDEFQVNELTTDEQSWPGVAVAADGSFVVVWAHEGLAPTDFGHSVRARRFGADGTPIGQEFQVNTYSPGYQYFPSVASGEDEFVVCWVGTQSPGNDHSDYSIQARRFAWDGTPRTDDFQVNSYTPNKQRAPACAADGSGGFVVSWQSLGSAGTDTSYTSVQARRWNDPFTDGFESGDTSRWSSTAN